VTGIAFPEESVSKNPSWYQREVRDPATARTIVERLVDEELLASRHDRHGECEGSRSRGFAPDGAHVLVRRCPEGRRCRVAGCRLAHHQRRRPRRDRASRGGDPGAATAITGSIRSRSRAGVSPVRTPTSGRWTLVPARSAASRMPSNGARRLRSTSTASARSGGGGEDEGVLTVGDGRPSLGLGVGRHRERRPEPLPDGGTEPRQHLVCHRRDGSPRRRDDRAGTAEPARRRAED
jgi:hypothetical protein